jgi:hypothetical protein
VARINFEDEWDNDPRRKNLIRLFVADSSTVEYAEFIADGLAKALWKFAQFHVTAEGAVIPRSTFKQMQAHSKLIEAGVVTEVEDGYFVEGSKRHLSWLHKKKAAGAKGGRATSETKKKSPRKPPSKPEALSSTLKQTEAECSTSNPLPLPTSSSSFSNSSSSNISDPVKNLPEGKTLGARIWDAYERAYELRWKVTPRRNATTNGQCAHIGKRLGEDAIAIVEFYLQHNDGFYLKTHHALGGLLRDAEALHTQWQRGQAVTSQQVRQFEKQSTNMDLLDKVRRGEA